MSTNPSEQSAAAELASTMRQLRAAAGISGVELARRLGEGFSQSKVSRIEKGLDRGGLAPTPIDAGRMAVQLDADPETRRRVIRLARDIAEAREGLVPVRVALLQNAPGVQRRIRQREQRARTVSTFHPSIVPGLLQTEAYMLSIADAAGATGRTAEVAGWLRERRLRQAARADLPAVQILSEGALWWGVSGAEVMAEQCDYIARLTETRPAWEIGIIPRLVPVGAAIDYPPNGFDLYDDDTVLVGTTAGNALVTDKPTVDSHLARLTRLRGLAVYGADARAVLARIAAEYRSLA